MHNYLLFFFLLVGWGTDQLSGFGEDRGTKHQVINLIHSIRTVMRSKIHIKVLHLQKVPISSSLSFNGRFQKISVPYHGWHRNFTPPCLRKFQNALPPSPPCLRNSISINPASPSEIVLFFKHPFGIPCLTV